MAGLERALTASDDVDEMAVAMLVECFGGDRSQDPGPDQPLAERVGLLSPTAASLRPFVGLPFLSGTEHEVNGEKVRFYMRHPGEPNRYAYVLNEPNRDIWYHRPLGGWMPRGGGVVRDRVFGWLISEVRSAAEMTVHILAPSDFFTDWKLSAEERKEGRERGAKQIRGFLKALEEVGPKQVGTGRWLFDGVCVEYGVRNDLVVVFGTREKIENLGLIEDAKARGLAVNVHERSVAGPVSDDAPGRVAPEPSANPVMALTLDESGVLDRFELQPGWPTLAELEELLERAEFAQWETQWEVGRALTTALLQSLPANFIELDDRAKVFLRAVSDVRIPMIGMDATLRLPDIAVDDYIAGRFDPTL